MGQRINRKLFSCIVSLCVRLIGQLVSETCKFFTRLWLMTISLFKRGNLVFISYKDIIKVLRFISLNLLHIILKLIILFEFRRIYYYRKRNQLATWYLFTIQLTDFWVWLFLCSGQNFKVSTQFSRLDFESIFESN